MKDLSGKIEQHHCNGRINYVNITLKIPYNIYAILGVPYAGCDAKKNSAATHASHKKYEKGKVKHS